MALQAEFKKYMMKRLGQSDSFIDLAFDLEWKEIELVKDFFEDFAGLCASREREVHRIGIAVCELLGNALKYSVKRRIRIVIQETDSPSMFIVSCENTSNKANIKRLVTRLAEMRFQEPLDYYLYRMRESVRNKLSSPGLGLARVHHEARADVCARITEKKRLVEVRAIINVN